MLYKYLLKSCNYVSVMLDLKVQESNNLLYHRNTLLNFVHLYV